MRIRTYFVLSTVLLVSQAATMCVAQPRSPAPAPPQTASTDSRAADRTAIRKTVDSFAKTFEARDAKSLAAHWTAEGEFQTVKGESLRGRNAMEQAFAEFFSSTPEVTAEMRPESLRFLSADSALDEGTVIVQRGPTELAVQASYRALLVREDGTWKLALMSESPASAEPSIADLGWLVGQWKSPGGGDTEIQTSYSWDAEKKFIHVQFTSKATDRVLSGSQVIGLDPATGMIHSWTFEHNGGIGEADWMRDGDHWVLDAAGTLADGRALTETNVLRRVNNDTFTWQSINRSLDDVELPDSAPVKVERIKTEP